MQTTLLDKTWALSRPLLFKLDAERAHRLVIGSLARTGGLARWVLRRLAGPPRPELTVSLGSLKIPSPIGLAAGLDKDGEAVRVWPELGFGFVEVGTVTAHPQPGNPGPRLFRLVAERGLINRMGFNNHGSAAMAKRLLRLREKGRWPKVPVGVNIGKSKITPLSDAIDDYCTSVKRLRECVDYFTVNVSSPNTPGLRNLQQPARLRELLESIVPTARDVPVLVKLSPDLALEELVESIDVSISAGCNGIITTNTTNSRPGDTGRLEVQGGLSGRPLWPLARSRIQTAISAAAGRVPVVGVGGISTAEQVRSLLDAGCAAVQLYSAMIFDGPGIVHRLNKSLVQHPPLIWKRESGS